MKPYTADELDYFKAWDKSQLTPPTFLGYLSY